MRRRKLRIIAGCATLLIAVGMGVCAPIINKLSATVSAKQHSGELEHALRLALFKPKGAPQRDLPIGYEDTASERAERPMFKIIPAGKPPAQTGDSAVSDVVQTAQQWWHSFGNNTQSKYLDIPDLTPQTVSNLKRAWVYDTPNHALNIQATPIFTGQHVVFPNAQHQIVAVEPDTGAVAWTFDPKIHHPAKRGLLFLQSELGGKIIFVAGGRVFVLNAENGTPDPDFGNRGSVALGYTARVAPQIMGDTLFVASMMPAIHAIDLNTGKQKWVTELISGEVFSSRLSRFFRAREEFAGANPWGGMALDPKRGLVFTSLSNPTPVGLGVSRVGPNAPANSVIAVNIADGTVAWVFQEIEHDLWDLDIAAPPVLAQIKRDGVQQDVVAIPTKAGNLLLLYRDNGEPVFDWRLRRTPTSEITGEFTAPYQPDPVRPKPFARMQFSTADISTLGPANTASAKAEIKGATYGFYQPHVPEQDTIFYGLHGGAMHMGAALDPENATLVVAASHVPSAFALTDRNRARQKVTRISGAGAEVYKLQCAACHGNKLQGGTGPALDNMDRAFPKHRLQSILQNGLRSMPRVDGVSAIELADLHRFLVRREGIVSQAIDPEPQTKDTPPNFTRTPYRKVLDAEGYPASKPPWGTLTAIDLNTGLHKWRVPLGIYPELMARGVPQTGTENLGGPIIVSGGLVFVSGTKDRLLRAFDLTTGAEVWSDTLPFVGSASPMVYRHNNDAYLVLPATGGGTLAAYDSSVATGGTFVAYRLEKP